MRYDTAVPTGICINLNNGATHRVYHDPIARQYVTGCGIVLRGEIVPKERKAAQSDPGPWKLCDEATHAYDCKRCLRLCGSAHVPLR